MSTTLTVTEIKDQFTNQEIQDIFDSEGLRIRIIDEKGDRDNGMTLAFNKEGSMFYFHSYILAYHYFLKMNWI